MYRHKWEKFGAGVKMSVKPTWPRKGQACNSPLRLEINFLSLRKKVHLHMVCALQFHAQ
jgi:hypothetical protein